MKDKIRYAAVGLAAAVPAVVASVPVCAAEGTTDQIQSALTTSFQSVGTTVTNTISTVLPIALPLIGAGIVITLGVKIFKRITSMV